MPGMIAMQQMTTKMDSKDRLLAGPFRPMPLPD